MSSFKRLGGSSFPVAIEPHIDVDAPLGPDETLLLCSDSLPAERYPHFIGAKTLSAHADEARAAGRISLCAFATSSGTSEK
jgi:PPM family protein phosphatase